MAMTTPAVARARLHAYSWGSGGCGVLGHGNTDDLCAPALIRSSSATIATHTAPTTTSTAAATPQQTLATALTFHAIASGGCHCLAITSAGELLSWGENQYAQCGTPPPLHAPAADAASDAAAAHPPPPVIASPIPLPLPPALLKAVVRSVHCGWWHSALLTTAGDCYTWGCGKHAQLGYPLLSASDEFVATPTRVTFATPTTTTGSGGGVEIVEMACGYKHSAAVDRSGRLWVWGDNKKGQLGLGCDGGATAAAPTAVLPVPVVAAFSQAVDRNTALAALMAAATAAAKPKKKSAKANSKTEDKAAVVASTDSKQPPPPATATAMVPTEPLPAVARVCCGREFTLVLTTGGVVYAFGHNAYGQCAIAAARTTDTATAAATATIESVGIPVGVPIAPLTASATATTTTAMPPAATSAAKVVAIACGWHHALALTTTGDVYAWGRGDYGQLGSAAPLSATTAASSSLAAKPRHCHVPSRVVFPSGDAATAAARVVEAIACGAEHSMAVLAPAKPTTAAAAVADSKTTTATTTATPTASGDTSSYALFGWGWNEHGNLATPSGDKRDRHTPTAIALPGGGRPSVTTAGASVIVLLPASN